MSRVSAPLPIPNGDFNVWGLKNNAVTGELQAAVNGFGDAVDHNASDFASALTSTAVKTANYAAAANEIVRCDASGGTFAVTLPTAPANGTRVVVKKVDSGSNAVTVSRGGTDVFNVTGGSTTLTLAYQFTSVTVQYFSGVWIVVASDVGADLRISGAVQTATLAALTTGLLKSTTGTGALSIAAAADIPLAAVGGTGPMPATARMDQLTAPTADVSLNSHKLTGVTSGTASTDGANVGQVNAAKSRREIAITAAGLISENFNLETASGTLAPTAGAAYGLLLGLQAGDVVTNLCVGVAVVGAGTAPTLIRLGLADPSGNIVAVTADVHASSLWTTSAIPVAVALSAPYTVPTTGGYRVVFLQVGSWGTTALQLAKGANLAAATLSQAIGSGIRKLALYGTGLSDLPSVGSALAASSGTVTNFWVGTT